MQAASATYRKAKRLIEKSLGIALPSTKYPSEDFQETVDFISDLTDIKILHAYETGLNRGLKQAMLWLADGTLVVQGDEIIVRKPLTVKVNRRRSDNSHQVLEYEFEPEDIGLGRVD